MLQPARVDQVAQARRTGPGAEPVPCLLQQRREPAVEAHLQPVVAGLLDRREHTGQFVPGQRQRLLHEHRLAGQQRLAGQFGVRAVPGDDEHRVDGPVAEHGVEIGGRPGEAELALRVGRGQRRRGDDGRQLDAVALCQVRQQHRRRVVSRAHEREPHRRPGGSGRTALHVHRGHGHRRRLRLLRSPRGLRVPEQHRHGLQIAVLQAPVRLHGVVEVGDVGDQRLHVDAAAGEEIEEARQIAALGPAHVADRVVPPLQLVLRVVTAGSVTAGEPDVELLLVVRVPGQVQTALADVDDPAAVPAEPGGQLDGLVVGAAGGQIHLVHAVTAGEFGDGGLHGRGRGIAAGRGAQPLGEFAAHRIGVDADDAHPGGGQQLHHQLSDQPEADDQRHLAQS